MPTSELSAADVLIAVRDIAETTTAREVPASALVAARSMLGVDAAVWMDVEGDEVTIQAVSGFLQPETHRSLRMSAHEGLIGMVLTQGEPVALLDYLRETSTPPSRRELLRREGVVSAAGVPIPGEGSRGVVVLISRTAREFAEAELRMAIGVAGIAQQLRDLRAEAERAAAATRFHRAVDALSLALLRGQSADVALEGTSDILGPRVRVAGLPTPGPAKHASDISEGATKPPLLHVPIPGAEQAQLAAEGGLPESALRTLAQVVGLDFARQRASMETEIRLTDQFVHSLLTADTDELSRLWSRSALLGMDMKVPRAVISISAKEPIGRPLLDRIVREMRSRTFSGQATTYKGAAFLLWPVSDQDAERKLPAQINELLVACRPNQVKAGLGPVCRGADDYPAAVKEAIFARQVAAFSSSGRNLVASKDLGMYRLFAHIGGVEALRGTVRETLGPLLEADAASGSDLTHTLRVYLERDRRIADTARALQVHVNTLRYRIERIGKLLKVDLDDPEARFFVTLALRLFPVVEEDAARAHLLDKG
ncbi:helix-turn-helix domain-containing protein [Streptomyces sp. P9-A2]|uniref:helix-turn-helix domain-containing protein n=1 Tax=Streptomyces sp. P9-A2 TaxID=3072284 RepID=UPI002FCC9A50